MHRLFRSQRLISRLAIFVMVAAALFPAMGNAFAHAAGTAWVEVCTTNGIELRGVVDDSTPVSSALPGEHCAYCLAPSDGDVLPVVAVPDIFPARVVALFPSLFVAAHDDLAWLAAPPRGPPVIL